jgi:hypothetical protein
LGSPAIVEPASQPPYVRLAVVVGPCDWFCNRRGGLRSATSSFSATSSGNRGQCGLPLQPTALRTRYLRDISVRREEHASVCAASYLPCSRVRLAAARRPTRHGSSGLPLRRSSCFRCCRDPCRTGLPSDAVPSPDRTQIVAGRMPVSRRNNARGQSGSRVSPQAQHALISVHLMQAEAREHLVSDLLIKEAADPHMHGAVRRCVYCRHADGPNRFAPRSKRQPDGGISSGIVAPRTPDATKSVSFGTRDVSLPLFPRIGLPGGHRCITFFSFPASVFHAIQHVARHSRRFSRPCTHFFSLPPSAGLFDPSRLLEQYCVHGSRPS